MENDKKQVVIASVILAILLILMVMVVLVVVINKKKLASVDYFDNDDPTMKYISVSDYSYDNASAFDKFRVQKVEFRDLDDSLTEAFMNKQQEFFERINGYETELFESNDADNNIIEGVVTVINHDNIASIVYKYNVELKDLDTNENGTFVLNIDLDKKKLVDNETIFQMNDKMPSDIASEIYVSVISALDFTKDTYIDIDSNKRVTKTSINDLKNTYIGKIENYLKNATTYMDNGSVIVVYKQSDILKLLFKLEDIKETQDVIYVV